MSPLSQQSHNSGVTLHLKNNFVFCPLTCKVLKEDGRRRYKGKKDIGQTLFKITCSKSTLVGSDSFLGEVSTSKRFLPKTL